MSVARGFQPTINVLCGVKVHPECSVHPALAERILLADLPKLFSAVTATVPDTTASPADARYLTITLFNDIPIVATHTERENEAHLLAVRPATPGEAATYRKVLLEKAPRRKWGEDGAAVPGVPELTEAAIRHSLWRAGGEGLGEVEVVLRFETR